MRWSGSHLVGSVWCGPCWRGGQRRKAYILFAQRYNFHMALPTWGHYLNWWMKFQGWSHPGYLNDTSELDWFTQIKPMVSIELKSCFCLSLLPLFFSLSLRHLCLLFCWWHLHLIIIINIIISCTFLLYIFGISFSFSLCLNVPRRLVGYCLCTSAIEPAVIKGCVLSLCVCSLLGRDDEVPTSILLSSLVVHLQWLHVETVRWQTARHTGACVQKLKLIWFLTPLSINV